MAISDLIGSSPKFRAVLDEINMVAPVNCAVLVRGEKGTGKEVIAQAIHEASPRRSNRFIALKCAAIPSALLESELFGHERNLENSAFESLRAHQRKRHVSRSEDSSLSPRVMPRRSLIQTRNSEKLVQPTAKK
jgi:transcriptional regulator with GAF, ATPase, and Fis domain